MTMFNQKTSQALSALGNRQDARLIRQALEFSTPMRLTFAELNAQYAPSPSRAGMHAWCTDYPSVGGYGAEVVCTGTRWKSISQQHCLLSPPSAVAGTLFATGSSAALYGSTVLIPGGVLLPDDNIRLIAMAQHPTIGSAARRIDLAFSTSSGGVVSSIARHSFQSTSTSSNNLNIEKLGTILDNTTLRLPALSQVASAVATNASQLEVTIPVISEDLYVGIVVTPSADTSWLMFAASVYVEFAR